jgi:hypothetical protein
MYAQVAWKKKWYGSEWSIPKRIQIVSLT